MKLSESQPYSVIPENPNKYQEFRTISGQSRMPAPLTRTKIQPEDLEKVLSSPLSGCAIVGENHNYRDQVDYNSESDSESEGMLSNDKSTLPDFSTEENYAFRLRPSKLDAQKSSIQKNIRTGLNEVPASVPTFEPENCYSTCTEIRPESTANESNYPDSVVKKECIWSSSVLQYNSDIVTDESGALSLAEVDMLSVHESGEIHSNGVPAVKNVGVCEEPSVAQRSNEIPKQTAKSFRQLFQEKKEKDNFRVNTHASQTCTDSDLLSSGANDMKPFFPSPVQTTYSFTPTDLSDSAVHHCNLHAGTYPMPVTLAKTPPTTKLSIMTTNSEPSAGDSSAKNDRLCGHNDNFGIASSQRHAGMCIAQVNATGDNGKSRFNPTDASWSTVPASSCGRENISFSTLVKEVNSLPVKAATDKELSQNSALVLSNNDFDDQSCEQLLNNTLKQLTIQSVLENSSDSVLDTIKLSTTYSDELRKPFQKIYNILKDRIATVKTSFVEFICLPDHEMQEEMCKFQNLKHFIPTSLPESTQSVLTKRINAIAEELNHYNKEIQEYEDVLMKDLLEEAIRYYREEINFLLQVSGDTVDDFLGYHETIQRETEGNFLNAASIKHQYFVDKYSSVFSKKIDFEFSDLKRQLLKLRANKAVIDAVNVYKTEFQRLQTDYVNGISVITNLEELDGKAKDKAHFRLQSFAAEMEGFIRPEDLQEIFNKFEEDTKAICNVLSNTMPFISVSSHQNKGTCIEPELSTPPEVVSSSGLGQSNDIDSEMDVDEYASEAEFFIPPEFPTAPPVADLELGISFGMHQTFAVVYDSMTEELQKEYEVGNELYYSNGSLIPRRKLDENLNSAPFPCTSVHSLPCLITPVQVFTQQGCVFFDVEKLIAFLIAGVKQMAEIDFRRTFSSAVICVPQCFNELQRTFVRDGAEIAGFQDALIISDTNAAAFAYAFQEKLKDGDIIVSIITGPHKDNALFEVNSGFIYPKGVSGSYFTKRLPDSLWESLMKKIEKSGRKHETLPDDIAMARKTAKMFRFGHKSTKKISNKDLSRRHFIVCGDSKSCGMIGLATHEDKVLWDFPFASLRPNFLSQAAAYVTALRHSQPDSSTRKRWASMFGREDIGTLIRHLQQMPQVLGCLEFQNSGVGRNLSVEELRVHIKEFGESQLVRFHKWKVFLLQKASQLLTEITRPERPSNIERTEDETKIRLFCQDLQTGAGESATQLMHYENNLAELYRKYNI